LGLAKSELICSQYGKFNSFFPSKYGDFGPISPKESPPPRPPPPPKSLSISKAGRRWDIETAKSVLNYWSWVVKGSKLIQLQLGVNGKNRKNSWDLSPINSREGGGVAGQKKRNLQIQESSPFNSRDSRFKPIQLQRFKIQAHSTPAFRRSCRVGGKEFGGSKDLERSVSLTHSCIFTSVCSLLHKLSNLEVSKSRKQGKIMGPKISHALSSFFGILLTTHQQSVDWVVVKSEFDTSHLLILTQFPIASTKVPESLE
jgi:hypothetical protein